MNIHLHKFIFPLVAISMLGISSAAVITTTDDGSIREGQSSTVQDGGTGRRYRRTSVREIR